MTPPGASTTVQPARVAILAAASLLTMPPVPTWLPLPPAIASISGVIALTSSSRTASGFRPGSAV